MASETPKAINTNNDTKVPPIPSPEPAPAPLAVSKDKILQREFVALNTCLKDAVVKTGQIYSFYADTHKLNIEKHVPNPPRSLTTALGRDIERYDQLCDSIEAHLLRAIGVLKHDLRKEEERIAAEQRRKNAESLMLPPALPPSSETTADVPPSHAPSEGSSTNPRNSPILSTVLGRRPSAISISSLHRPQFPLKLDLSATSLRITEEEAALYSKGLASPVTLAPKSARPVGPNEFPPEFMAAFAAGSSVPLDATHVPTEIDLALPHDIHLPHNKSDLDALGVGLGDSSDKPIMLDLEAMDIEMANMANSFGPSAEPGLSDNPHDGLFSPVLGDGDGEGPKNGNTSIKEGDALSNFNVNSTATDELFGDFSPSGDLGVDLNASDATIIQPQSSSIPSPGSLLAQFSETSDLMNVKASPSDNPALHETGQNFDTYSLDLSNLASEMGFSNATDMDAFLQSDYVLNMDSIQVDQKGEVDNTKS